MNRHMRQYKRSARFNRLLQEEISYVIRTQLKDPRIGLAGISRVEATDDLRSSKIYVSVLKDSEAGETIKALQNAAGLIRSKLRHRLHTRRVPELRFFLDENIAYSVHIAEVLDSLKKDHDRKEDGEQDS